VNLYCKSKEDRSKIYNYESLPEEPIVDYGFDTSLNKAVNPIG